MNKYHVVYEFSLSAEDFVIRGIYTLPSDASAHCEKLRSEGGQCVAIVDLDHEALVHRLIEARLGKMADALNALINKPKRFCI